MAYQRGCAATVQATAQLLSEPELYQTSVAFVHIYEQVLLKFRAMRCYVMSKMTLELRFEALQENSDSELSIEAVSVGIL